MTDSEMMQAILNEIKAIKQDNLELKQGFQELKLEIQEVKQEVQEVKQEVQELKQDVQVLSARVDNLEKEVKHNTVAIETTVAECLKAYGDGYIANREKMDSLHIDTVNSKINHLDLRQKVMEDELKRLKLKIS